jgi:hypothetical protein
MAAGVTWTSRATSAEWAARFGHTSVIDAAGAIYVIGGTGSGGTFFSDVWVSTDGGADRTCAGLSGGTAWVVRGYLGGTTDTTGALRCTVGVLGVHEGCLGVPEGTLGVLQMYSRGTPVVL